MESAIYSRYKFAMMPLRNLLPLTRTVSYAGNAAKRSLKKKYAPLSRLYSQTKSIASLPVLTSIEEAKKMPRHYNEMPGSLILTMACSGKFRGMNHFRKLIDGLLVDE